MLSMSKFIAVAALALAVANVPSACAAIASTEHPTTTTTLMPVNLGENVVTIVLVLGVAIAITVAFLLYKTIPKCRRGEIKLSKIEFDWRAELLNQTPKKEKARRAEEKARRDAERAAAAAEMEFAEQGEHHYQPTEPLSPHRAAVPSATASEKRVQVEVLRSSDHRSTH
jgi:hypothetical protein